MAFEVCSFSMVDDATNVCCSICNDTTCELISIAGFGQKRYFCEDCFTDLMPMLSCVIIKCLRGDHLTEISHAMYESTTKTAENKPKVLDNVQITSDGKWNWAKSGAESE